MKIAICGSGGTGKSTLVKAFAEEMGWAIIPEFAREACESLGVKTPKDLTEEQVGDFQKYILERKIKEERRHCEFVADRGCMDSLAYFLLRIKGGSCMSDLEKNSYIEMAQSSSSFYDYVFVLERGVFPIEDDQFRTTDKHYQLLVHYVIKGILSDLNIPFISIEEGSVRERVDFIKQVLRDGRDV